MKKSLLTVLSLILLTNGVLYAFDMALPPVQESEAYKRYSVRSQTELSKILFLIDRLKGVDVKILYNDTPYTPEEAVPITRKYIAKNYRNEKAEVWISKHCHRTDPGGKLILVEAPDGTTRPAKDVLLEELKTLEQVSKK